MKVSKIYIALTSTFAFSCATAGQSESTMLDIIEVVATRDPSKFADSPQKLTKDQLTESQAESVASALKDISNVDVQGGQEQLLKSRIFEV